MDWITIGVGIAGVLLPALLSKLGVNVPVIIPTPNTPQVPTVDKPLADCLVLLDQYTAKTAVPDATDMAAMNQIAAKIATLTGVAKPA